MATKPTVEEARLILELYSLRGEPEMRRARQWWLTYFWPTYADDFISVAMDFGSQENNWLRQVGSYWGIATTFVLHGIISEKLFFGPAFCAELYFMFAKVRPFLKEIREKAKNRDLFLLSEKAIYSSKLGRAQFETVEACVKYAAAKAGGLMSLGRRPFPRLSRVIRSTAWGLFLLPALASAKTPLTCGPGVTLQLSAPVSSQGSLLLLEVRSRKPLTEVSAEWNSKNVPFWHVSSEPSEAGKVPPVDRRQALLGVDLEKPPGSYPVLVHLQTAGDQPDSCTFQIPVRAGKFAIERLQVGKEFVEPSPEQIKRANEERDKLRSIFDQVTPEKLWDGDFRVPLDGVTTGGNFGKRRILNGQPGSPHSGVDFPSPTGTPIHAAQRGHVALAEELFFSGNTVVVDHGLGIYTFYGHLSEIDVKVGDALETGQVLGKVGSTGRVTGPHLHWGLTVERARVNPLQLVKLLGQASDPIKRRRARTKRK